MVIRLFLLALILSLAIPCSAQQMGYVTFHKEITEYDDLSNPEDSFPEGRIYWLFVNHYTINGKIKCKIVNVDTKEILDILTIKIDSNTLLRKIYLKKGHWKIYIYKKKELIGESEILEVYVL